MLKTMSGLGDMIGNTQSIIYIGCSAYSSVLNTGSKVLMQGELFQRCSHFLYCSVLSLGGNVNTRRMSKSYMESIFKKKIYSGLRKLLCEFSKLSKLNVFILGY